MFSGRIMAAARRVSAHVALILDSSRHDHERGPQGFVEERVIPETFVLTGQALTTAIHVLAGLTVDTRRMRMNLDANRGLVLAEAATMALAPHLGRLRAKDLVHEACMESLRDDRPLKDVLGDDPSVADHLDKADLERIMDPANYIGNAGDEVDEIVAHARSLI